MELNLKIISVVLAGIGSMLAILKFLLGLKASSKAINLKNLEMIKYIKYNDENYKQELINSEVFKGLTGVTAWIHHINFMFNAPDPGRLLEIYRKAPALVGFGKTSTTVPFSIKKPLLRLFYIWLIVLMAAYPFFSSFYIYFDTMINSGKHPFIYALITFFLLSPMTLKGIFHLSFIFDVNEYYKQCYPEELNSLWFIKIKNKLKKFFKYIKENFLTMG